MNQIRVTVWNEYRHEREDERYRSVYPDGIHGAIAEGLGASADPGRPYGNTGRTGKWSPRRRIDGNRCARLVGAQGA